jgi:hypothetical protein
VDATDGVCSARVHSDCLREWSAALQSGASMA